MDAVKTNPQGIPAGMTLVGAVIAAASTLLLWMKLEAADTPTVEAKGLDLDMGAFVLLSAIVVIILAIIQLVRGTQGGGRGLAIANIVLAALMLFAALYVVVSPGDAFAAQAADEVAEQFGIDEGLAEEAIQEGVEQGQVDVSAQIGAFIGLIGSLLALVGAIMGTIRAKRGAGGGPAAPGTFPPSGTMGPGAAGPGAPGTGGTTSSPSEPTGSTAPPPGTPPGGPHPPRQ